MKETCKLCGLQPRFYGDGTFNRDGSVIELAVGPWTRLFAGIEEDGRIRLTAEGDYEADYYPKYCPECGRRLEVQS